MTLVHFVLPNDIDDPARPSGGNVYDRRVVDGLAEAGWRVAEHRAYGSWPSPSPQDLSRLGRCLGELPQGALTVLDGLVACAAPRVLEEHAARLRLIVLVHMPFADEGERAALAVAAAIVTTSRWSRSRLLALYSLPEQRVRVAIPGAQAGPVAPGTPSGQNLLCVGAVLPHKGYDLLVQALGELAELPFRVTCVGSQDLDPAYAAAVRRQLRDVGLAQRVTFTGPCAGQALQARYTEADLLVVASRAESYGMVVTEALAHGVPVLATATQGLPEAVGRTPGGELPGLLVPPEDSAALARALRSWLGGEQLRRELRRRALERRGTLAGWAATTAVFAGLFTSADLGGAGSRCVEDFADKP